MEKELNEDDILNPKWINEIDKETFLSIIDIYKFYVLNTPITGISAQSKDISEYGWNSEQMWSDKYYFIDKLDKLIYENVETLKSGMTLKKYMNKNIDESLLNLYKNEMILFNNKKKINDMPIKFYYFFNHIRNSLAHGRFIIKDDLFIMEDISNKKIITAIIIIKKSRLINIMNYIISDNNKKYIDYSNEIYEIIKSNINTKNDILKKLNLTNEKFNYYFNRIKEKIVYENKQWKIKNK